MSWNNKVIWSEGMFIRPQHFQQQIRYIENFIEGRCSAFGAYGWGFSALKIDQKLLSLGKFSITEARGIFPDGTPFNIPEDDPSPGPFDVPDNARNAVVYLSLPLKRQGVLDADVADAHVGLVRNRLCDDNTMDATSTNNGAADIQVGQLGLSYLLESEVMSDHTTIAIAKIVERKADSRIVLNSHFIPPAVSCQAVSVLTGFLNELSGLLQHRVEALAGRVSLSGRGGAAEISDYLFLQVVNRYTPIFAHYAAMSVLHPESLYRDVIALAGELATFTGASRQTASFPVYKHHDLEATFTPAMDDVRQALTTVLEQKAIPIPLKEKRYGIHVGDIGDKTLLEHASFVLAVSADMPNEALRSDFPSRVKIGSVEQISELVNVQLQGIKVNPLPVAPRQIPYHAGSIYFELEKGGEYWNKLKLSGAIALHLSGEFPGISMEFWAIKGG